MRARRHRSLSNESKESENAEKGSSTPSKTVDSNEHDESSTNNATKPTTPERSENSDDDSIDEDLFPATPPDNRSTANESKDKTLLSSKDVISSSNVVDENSEIMMNNAPEDETMLDKVPKNPDKTTATRKVSINTSKDSEEKSKGSSKRFNLSNNARQTNKKGTYTKIFKNRAIDAVNSTTNDNNGIPGTMEKNDYLAERFEYQKNLDTFDENALSEESKKWDGASSVEIALVECVNDDHGGLQAGCEAHFLVLLYHYCQSLEERALVLAILQRTNENDATTMNTFLTIGGLHLLDIWLNEARTPIIKERKVLKPKPPAPKIDPTVKRRGRPAKQPVEVDEYEYYKEYVSSKTGPLLLTLIQVLTEIPLCNNNIIMESGLTKDILKLQKTLNSLQNDNATDLDFPSKNFKGLVDDLLYRDKYPLSAHPLAGGSEVQTLFKAIIVCMQRWKVQSSHNPPIVTQKQYFEPLLTKIRSGYDALCAYEKGEASKPDWFLAIELESDKKSSSLKQPSPASNKKSTSSLKQPSLSKKLKQGNVSRSSFSRVNARKRQMDLVETKENDEQELEKKQKLQQRLQERERLRAEALEKKQRLHAKLAERKAPLQAAKKKALNAYHNEMDVSLKDLNMRKSFSRGSYDNEDDDGNVVIEARVVDSDSTEENDEVEVEIVEKV